MNCPACPNTLSPVQVGEVTVDACQGGCGGLWFDKGELASFDEPHEHADPLLSVRVDPQVVADRGRHGCPHCEGVVLMRHHFSTRFEVEVDECPGCGGFWLDHGELERIRAEFDTVEERQAADEAFLAENLVDHMQTVESEVSDELERAGSLARLFRWVCPSAWIPGKQNWGNH